MAQRFLSPPWTRWRCSALVASRCLRRLRLLSLNTVDWVAYVTDLYSSESGGWEVYDHGAGKS